MLHVEETAAAVMGKEATLNGVFLFVRGKKKKQETLHVPITDKYPWRWNNKWCLICPFEMFRLFSSAQISLKSIETKVFWFDFLLKYLDERVYL